MVFGTNHLHSIRPGIALNTTPQFQSSVIKYSKEKHCAETNSTPQNISRAGKMSLAKAFAINYILIRLQKIDIKTNKHLIIYCKN